MKTDPKGMQWIRRKARHYDRDRTKRIMEALTGKPWTAVKQSAKPKI